MQPHSHGSMCVSMRPLIKLLGRAIQHVPWKQGLPWKECLLVASRSNEGLIPPFLTSLNKWINPCNYWHQQKSISLNESSDPTHAQGSILGIRAAVICAALCFRSSFPAIPPSAPRRRLCWGHASFEAQQGPEPQRATAEPIRKVPVPHLFKPHADSARTFSLPDPLL